MSTFKSWSLMITLVCLKVEDGLEEVCFDFFVHCWLSQMYEDENECWSNWGGFSAQENRCYRANCGNPKKGHLVTLQLQGKAQIREFVVLTSECKVKIEFEI